MLNASLPQHAASIKTLELDPDCHAKPTNEGTLVIRLRLNGIDSVEILANQSETQAQLMELWGSVRPAVDVVLGSLR